MKPRLRMLSLAAMVAATLSACASTGSPQAAISPDGSTTPRGPIEPGAPTIVAIFTDVDWYPPCAISPIELGGDLYYPIPYGAPPVDESLYPLVLIVPPGTTLVTDDVSLAMVLESISRVMPPGPGDDIGTVIVYSDGMARFESHSRNVAWLTREVQEYGYVC